jgi:Bacterial type II/III secretion system short domain
MNPNRNVLFATIAWLATLSGGAQVWAQNGPPARAAKGAKTSPAQAPQGTATDGKSKSAPATGSRDSDLAAGAADSNMPDISGIWSIESEGEAEYHDAVLRRSATNANEFVLEPLTTPASEARIRITWKSNTRRFEAPLINGGGPAPLNYELELLPDGKTLRVTASVDAERKKELIEKGLAETGVDPEELKNQKWTRLSAATPPVGSNAPAAGPDKPLASQTNSANLPPDISGKWRTNNGSEDKSALIQRGREDFWTFVVLDPGFPADATPKQDDVKLTIKWRPATRCFEGTIPISDEKKPMGFRIEPLADGNTLRVKITVDDQTRREFLKDRSIGSEEKLNERLNQAWTREPALGSDQDPQARMQPVTRKAKQGPRGPDIAGKWRMGEKGELGNALIARSDTDPNEFVVIDPAPARKNRAKQEEVILSVKWRPETRRYEGTNANPVTESRQSYTFEPLADGSTMRVTISVDEQTRGTLLKDLAGGSESLLNELLNQVWTRELPAAVPARARDVGSNVPQAANDEIKVFRFQYADPSMAAETLQTLFAKEPLQISADRRTMSLIVKGNAEILMQVEAILMRLDVDSPTVAGLPKIDRPAPERPRERFPALPDGPVVKNLLEQLHSQEAAAASLAATIRQLQVNGPAPANQKQLGDAQRKLKNLLNTAFGLKLQLEELQVQELRSRLGQLERQIGQRNELREKIIDRRARDLIEGEGVQWESPGTGTPKQASPPGKAQTSAQPDPKLPPLEGTTDAAPPRGRPTVGSPNDDGTTQVRFGGAAGTLIFIEGTSGDLGSSPRQRFQRQRDKISSFAVEVQLAPRLPDVVLAGKLDIYPAEAATAAFLAHNAVPLNIVVEDTEYVRAGNAITKVVYLPHPVVQSVAVPGVETLVSSKLDPGKDPILEANRRGTILVVLHLVRDPSRLDLLNAPRGVVANSIPPSSVPASAQTVKLLCDQVDLVFEQVKSGQVRIADGVKACQDLAEVDPAAAVERLKSLLEISELWFKADRGSRVDIVSVQAALALARERARKLPAGRPPATDSGGAQPDDSASFDSEPSNAEQLQKQLDRLPPLDTVRKQRQRVTETKQRVHELETKYLRDKTGVADLQQAVEFWTAARRELTATWNQADLVIRQVVMASNIQQEHLAALKRQLADNTSKGGLELKVKPAIDAAERELATLQKPLQKSVAYQRELEQVDRGDLDETSSDADETAVPASLEALRARMLPLVVRTLASEERARRLEVDYSKTAAGAAELGSALAELARSRNEQRTLWKALVPAFERWNLDYSTAEVVASSLERKFSATMQQLADGIATEAEVKAVAESWKKAKEAASREKARLEKFNTGFGMLESFEVGDEGSLGYGLASPAGRSYHPQVAQAWLEAATGLKLELVRFDDLNLWFKAALRVREASRQFQAGDLIVTLNQHLFETLDQAVDGFRLATIHGQNDNGSIVLRGGLAGTRSEEHLRSQTWQQDILEPASPRDAIIKLEVRVRSEKNGDAQTQYIDGACVAPDGLVAIPIPAKSLAVEEPVVVFGGLKGTGRVVASNDKCGLTLLKLNCPDCKMFHWTNCRSALPARGQLLELDESQNHHKEIPVLETGQPYPGPRVGNDAFVVDRLNFVKSGALLSTVNHELQGIVIGPTTGSHPERPGTEGENRYFAIPAVHIEKLISDYRATVK